jgi:hypothetical protein
MTSSVLIELCTVPLQRLSRAARRRCVTGRYLRRQVYKARAIRRVRAPIQVAFDVGQYPPGSRRQHHFLSGVPRMRARNRIREEKRGAA